MRTAAYVLSAWLVLSLPVGVVVGMWLGRRQR